MTFEIIIGITMLVAGVNLLIIIAMKNNKTSDAIQETVRVSKQERKSNGKFHSKFEMNEANIEYISGLANTFTNKEIAEIVGVHPSTIGRIMNKKTKII